MLEDVQSWKNSKVFGDVPHIKTGATALHVAAAKGYIKVIGLLIQAGAPVNAQVNNYFEFYEISNSQETQFKMVWSTLYFEDTRWIKSICEVKCCQPGSAVPFKYD